MFKFCSHKTKGLFTRGKDLLFLEYIYHKAATAEDSPSLRLRAILVKVLTQQVDWVEWS